MPAKEPKRSIVQIFFWSVQRPITNVIGYCFIIGLWSEIYSKISQSVFAVVKGILHGGFLKKKMMSCSFDFKLIVLRKLTENEIECIQQLNLKTAKEFNYLWKCPHLRAHGDSLKGACAAKCLKFDFEKFENLIIPLKRACAPMRGNRVFSTEVAVFLAWHTVSTFC